MPNEVWSEGEGVSLAVVGDAVLAGEIGYEFAISAAPHQTGVNERHEVAIGISRGEQRVNEARRAHHSFHQAATCGRPLHERLIISEQNEAGQTKEEDR